MSRAAVVVPALTKSPSLPSPNEGGMPLPVDGLVSSTLRHFRDESFATGIRGVPDARDLTVVLAFVGAEETAGKQDAREGFGTGTDVGIGTQLQGQILRAIVVYAATDTIGIRGQQGHRGDISGHASDTRRGPSTRTRHHWNRRGLGTLDDDDAGQ